MDHIIKDGKFRHFVKTLFFRGHLFSYVGMFVFVYGLSSGSMIDNVKILYK